MSCDSLGIFVGTAHVQSTLYTSSFFFVLSVYYLGRVHSGSTMRAICKMRAACLPFAVFEENIHCNQSNLTDRQRMIRAVANRVEIYRD